jgi:site-specific DNA-methyltransferase (adenine-specific)
LLDGAQADCLWTDPPYGVEYEGKTAKRLTLANDEAASSDGGVLGTFRLAPLAPSSPCYIASPAGPRMRSFLDTIEAVGWRLHQELVWSKGTIVLVWVHAGSRAAGSRQPRWFPLARRQQPVLRAAIPSPLRIGITRKPVGLVEQCLATAPAPPT